LDKKRPVGNYKLRSMRLAAGMTEGQVAEEVARIVTAQTGRELAINGNYISKLERGVITWPNRAYRQAFGTLFGVSKDPDLGFYPSRTRRDAESCEAITARGKVWTARS
jgi:transcriptional regulator with XRE-family HTH domain